MTTRKERNRMILRRRKPHRRQRRGVLLLIVLSILMMFMLVGAAFVLTGSHYGDGERANERANRAKPLQADLLDRALRQVLRDTQNQASAIRYHSLLRDLYGTDGFVAVAQDTTLPQVAPQYAGAWIAGDALGPAEGQLIDIFVRDVDWDNSLNPTGTPPLSSPKPSPSERHALQLETDGDGLPIEFDLPRTDGYYNGCLLTILSGPAKGQSARIVAYDYMGDNAEFGVSSIPASMRFTDEGEANTAPLDFFRFRVLVFPGGSGGNLTLDYTGATQNELAGQTFMVNGRPFNGSGVGLNLLAESGGAKLTAYEAVRNSSGAFVDGAGFFMGGPLALLPNSRYYSQLFNGQYNLFRVNEATGSPVGFLSSNDLDPLDPANNAVALYTSFIGPGGADESYDAPDYQNMFLASSPLQPRARGRVFTSANGYQEVADYYSGGATSAPQRLDLDGLPIPSFHRPALANYWMHKLFKASWLSGVGESDRVKGILRPYLADGSLSNGLSAAQAAQIVAFKRKYLLRPLVEDHPNFTGSNSQLAALYELIDSSNSFIYGDDVSFPKNITFPSFEVAGPWDVDNDGDGVPDSIWVDLGMPVQETEDGRLYKPLFALLVQDLDGKLNLNAHGSGEHLARNLLDKSVSVSNQSTIQLTQNLVDGINRAVGALRSSDQLPTGSGWGPADVSLRSIFSPEFLPNNLNSGNPEYDDFARLLVGRPPQAVDATSSQVASVWGRHGSIQVMNSLYPWTPNNRQYVQPGVTQFGDPLLQVELFGYPTYVRDLFPSRYPASGSPSYTPSGFASICDLYSRYATALDYGGACVEEAANDQNARWLVADSPYELDLSDRYRKVEPAAELASQIISAGYSNLTPDYQVNDDAPFSPAELERLLRAYDADAGRLPDRLWELTDAFDPAKLVKAYSTTPATPSPGELLQAQLEASIRRRSVTTESFDIPSTNEDWTSRLLYGADGLPGVAGQDDDGANGVDDVGEVNALGSDDYFAVMGRNPPTPARLIDYLRYRVALELRKQSSLISDTAINRIIHGDNNLRSDQVRNARYSFGGLIAPEVLAGLKMDLNRPFGDGKDNGDGIDNDGNGLIDDPAELGTDPFMNGVVDEPFEAGESYIEGGPHQESNGLAGYQSVLDRLWDRDSDSNGTLGPGEFTPFNHANGQDANGRGAFTPGGDRIHDDGQMARQLYARHLYCLAMLLMDENYLAPYDANDPQVVDYLDPDAEPDDEFSKAGSPAWQIRQGLISRGLPDDPDTSSRAVRLARKKLTCRRIAQWAINCAEMRDPDAICTPFEYDENPWDGWNVVETTGGTPVIYPLDGDPGTDENNRWVVRVNDSGFLPPARLLLNNNPAADDNQIAAQFQSRGVVWGMERPELLITETFAFHDRRVEDLEFEDPSIEAGQQDENGNPISNQNKQIGFVPTQQEENEGIHADATMDQRLRPEGGAFVELYNPWGIDGQMPAELYRGRDLDDEPESPFYNDRVGGIDTPLGVDLALLSPVGVPAENDATNIQFSPVWRMIAVEEHPRLRNDDPIDDATQNAQYDPSGIYQKFLPKEYEDFDEVNNPRMLQIARKREGRAPYKAADHRARVPDPDFPTFNQDAQPRLAPGPDRTVTIQRLPDGASQPWPREITRFRFSTPRQYVERAFYFTSNNDGTRDPENLKVRIPLGRVKIPTSLLDSQVVIALRRMEAAELWQDGIAIVTDNGRSQLEIFNHHFVPNAVELFEASTVEEPDGDVDIADLDLAIAPVLPGRYCVLGTAGYSYNVNQNSGRKKHPGRFITPLGRQSRFVGEQNDRSQIIGRDAFRDSSGQMVFGTRRIELIPWPDPDCHQVMVDDNGGCESWLIDRNGDGTHDRNLLRLFGASIDDDIVAGDDSIRPVRGKFASNAEERLIQPAVAVPVNGMSLSAPVDNYLLRRLELEPTPGQRNLAHVWLKNQAFGEGEFCIDSGGDMAPYDEPFDLPRELVENHTTPNYRSVHLQRLANPLLPWNPLPGEEFHSPNLPVNPYLTIDGSSVDLTAFNGTDPKEASIGNRDARSNSATPDYPAQLHEWDAPLPGDGALNVAREPLMSLASNQRGLHAVNVALFDDPAKADPARLIFQQEPINILEELDFVRLSSRNKMSFPEHRDELNMIPELVPREHVMDFPIYHSLGFMNQPALRPSVISTRPGQPVANVPNLELPIPDNRPNFYTQSDGELYNNIDANGDGLVGDMVGTPKTALGGSDRDDDTYAALQWGNRPFASALEMLQVPASGSGSFTREFTTFNPNLYPITEWFLPVPQRQGNPYNGAYDAAWVNNKPLGGEPINQIELSGRANVARFQAERGQFGHLLNLFSSSVEPPKLSPITDDKLFAVEADGAANLSRLNGYLGVRSRYVGTHTTLNPTVFSSASGTVGPLDPRNDLQAPFNKMDQYREPGKVNLNTVVGQVTSEPRRGASVLASPVYDGLMHRVADQNYWNNNGTPLNDSDDTLIQIGHRGPAWRDVTISRRGYVNPAMGSAVNDTSMMSLHKDSPTFFSNPFREAEEGTLVPLQTLVRAGAEATLLRSHPFTPKGMTATDLGGTTYRALWGEPGIDDQGDGLREDASEAGLGDDDDLFADAGSFEVQTGRVPEGFTEDYVLGTDADGDGDVEREDPFTPDVDQISEKVRVPLFSAGTTEPALNSHRNAGLRYLPMTRLSSMTTTRSGSFAIWITVGFFEVSPAPEYSTVSAKFLNNRQLYDRVYPDGYQLGKELGSETGDTHRYRGFWIVDRTLPVAFRPGQDVNLEKMILLRREVE